jgi:hypothetical protein
MAVNGPAIPPISDSRSISRVARVLAILTLVSSRQENHARVG